MKQRHSYILIYMLICILSIAGIMEGRSLYTGIQQSKKRLNIEISSFLKQAAEKNGKIKNKTIPWIGNFNVRPELIGSYENRTFHSADTTFSYRHKIENIENELNQSNQHFLLLTNQLHSSDIECLLDSLLRNNNIKAQIAIGITSTGYPQKTLPWSKDTLHMNIHGRAHYILEADIAQIHYTACLKYSFITLWKEIEDKSTLLLWGIIIFMAGGSLAIVYFFFLRKKDKSKGIPENETITTSPKPVIIIQEEIVTEVVEIVEEIEKIKEAKKSPLPFEIEKGYILFKDKTKKLAPQSEQILQMFLNAENYQVKKQDLKELWPGKNFNSTSNMTSAVNRINDIFEEIGCKSEIITDPKNRNSYLLK